MITLPDFQKKQIIFVFANEGERLSLLNDNLLVKDKEEKVKLQCTCYRLFIVFIIGHCSITTPIIQASRKYGFFFAFMTSGFHLYSVIGAEKDGNTLLKEKQYAFQDLSLAKHIIQNKISNSIVNLKRIRVKTDFIKEGIVLLEEYLNNLPACNNRNEIMAYEGLASKVYFERYFSNYNWKGRQPRLKKDTLNATLDIGYTLLFQFLDSLLSCYGFDTYLGVLHTRFYMRKSLVCDLEEPFRVLIDSAVRKAINLKQIQEKDFEVFDGRYILKWTENKKYVNILMAPILEYKAEIFLYIQAYYRAFMKENSADMFPTFEVPEWS